MPSVDWDWKGIGLCNVPPPSLNPALLWSEAGAGRVKKSNERTGAVSGDQKIERSVSGAEREVV